MIEATDIAFVFHPVSDLERSRKFYEGCLGLKPERVMEMDGAHVVEYAIGPATLSIGQMDLFMPSPDGVVAALKVKDFDDAMATLQAAEVEFYMERFETPICEMALVLDPDGSKICIHKRKPGHD